MAKNKSHNTNKSSATPRHSNRRRQQPTDTSLGSSSKLEEGDRASGTVKESDYIGSSSKLEEGDRASGTVKESVKSSFPKLGLGHISLPFGGGPGRGTESLRGRSPRRSDTGDRRSATVKESVCIGSEGKSHPVSPAPTKMHGKTHPTARTSSSWTLIRPKLDEIERLIGEEFVPLRDVPTKHFGISYQTFLTLRGKHPELEEAVQHGKAHRTELVLKGMYDLATGRAVRVEDEKAPDEKGNLRITKRRIIRFEPQADIGTTLMKQYAGWSDNPKTDNAVANALNNKEWTAKLSLIPGFSDLSPKSSDADNFKASPKDTGNRADAPAAQGENYNSDSLADQKNAEKEDNDDDSGE